MPTPILPTSLRIPRPLKAKLVRYAKAEQRPLSVQIVFVLEQWTSWKEKQELEANAAVVGSATASEPARR